MLFGNLKYVCRLPPLKTIGESLAHFSLHVQYVRRSWMRRWDGGRGMSEERKKKSLLLLLPKKSVHWTEILQSRSKVDKISKVRQLIKILKYGETSKVSWKITAPHAVQTLQNETKGIFLMPRGGGDDGGRNSSRFFFPCMNEKSRTRLE